MNRVYKINDTIAYDTFNPKEKNLQSTIKEIKRILNDWWCSWRFKAFLIFVLVSAIIIFGATFLSNKRLLIKSASSMPYISALVTFLMICMFGFFLSVFGGIFKACFAILDSDNMPIYFVNRPHQKREKIITGIFIFVFWFSMYASIYFLFALPQYITFNPLYLPFNIIHVWTTEFHPSLLLLPFLPTVVFGLYIRPLKNITIYKDKACVDLICKILQKRTFRMNSCFFDVRDSQGQTFAYFILKNQYKGYMNVRAVDINRNTLFEMKCDFRKHKWDFFLEPNQPPVGSMDMDQFTRILNLNEDTKHKIDDKLAIGASLLRILYI